MSICIGCINSRFWHQPSAVASSLRLVISKNLHLDLHFFRNQEIWFRETERLKLDKKRRWLKILTEITTDDELNWVPSRKWKKYENWKVVGNCGKMPANHITDPSKEKQRYQLLGKITTHPRCV